MVVEARPVAPSLGHSNCPALFGNLYYSLLKLLLGVWDGLGYLNVCMYLQLLGDNLEIYVPRPHYSLIMKQHQR